ncbi:hypothetical protein B484DRAFT_270509 [Ochromonadaceae sp. CCMP2298]|nr:hypothetical protein B484DRAFT_270509 [Ochromonadaceae sp. CCMP2298]
MYMEGFTVIAYIWRVVLLCQYMEGFIFIQYIYIYMGEGWKVVLLCQNKEGFIFISGYCREVGVGIYELECTIVVNIRISVSTVRTIYFMYYVLYVPWKTAAWAGCCSSRKGPLGACWWTPAQNPYCCLSLWCGDPPSPAPPCGPATCICPPLGVGRLALGGGWTSPPAR